MKDTGEKRKTALFIFLCGIFLTNAILAEIVGTKIFSLEATLNWAPAQLHVWSNFILDFNLTAGVVLWPFVFITTDIINEYFGKPGVRRISYLAAGFIAYSFFIIYLVTSLSPAQFWLDINSTDADGNTLNINNAFNAIFRQGLWIIVGSLVAFLIGQLIDVFVFHKLKQVTGNKMIWLRATGSTLVSQLVDSFVVLFIAFYVGANWTFDQVIAICIINYLYKFGVAVVLTPLLYVAHYGIDHYLGKELSEKMTTEASRSEGLF